jgi:hypothetical protein
MSMNRDLYLNHSFRTFRYNGAVTQEALEAVICELQGRYATESSEWSQRNGRGGGKSEYMRKLEYDLTELYELLKEVSRSHKALQEQAEGALQGEGSNTIVPHRSVERKSIYSLAQKKLERSAIAEEADMRFAEADYGLIHYEWGKVRNLSYLSSLYEQAVQTKDNAWMKEIEEALAQVNTWKTQEEKKVEAEMKEAATPFSLHREDWTKDENLSYLSFAYEQAVLTSDTVWMQEIELAINQLNG